MFLTAHDENFDHQTSLPHMMVSSSDPNWRERYWFSLQHVERRDFILSGGFGKYPNKDVLEGCIMVRHEDRQWNLRVSRALLPEPGTMAVGPLSVEIVQPFRALRFRLEENDSEMAFDLLWTSDWPAFLEERHFEVSRGRVTHDIIRYIQLGRWQGEVQVAGKSFDFTAATGWGERDHSWGIRPMASVPGDPPIASADWNFLWFCPMQFEDFALHLYIFESQAGRPTHLTAAIHDKASAYAGDPILAVDHELEWDYGPSVRTLVGGRLTLHFQSRRTLDIDLKALPPRVYLQGGGYGVDQGNWKGDYHREHDSWDLSDPATLKNYIKGTSDHMFEATCEGRTGYGIVEYLVRSAYEKYPRRGRAG
jgi:hypothetical protein